MATRKRTFVTAAQVGVVAGDAPPAGLLSATLSQDPAPVQGVPGVDASTPASVAPGAAAVAVPVAPTPAVARTRAPRLAPATLPESERAEWRHRLRAAAGKLAQTYRAGELAEQTWERVAGQARIAGVPEVMLTAALADAGLSAGEDS